MSITLLPGLGHGGATPRPARSRSTRAVGIAHRVGGRRRAKQRPIPTVILMTVGIGDHSRFCLALADPSVSLPLRGNGANAAYWLADSFLRGLKLCAMRG